MKDIEGQPIEGQRIFIKGIVEHLSIFTALIFILGLIKLTLFYKNFSISIKSFIGVSEIATSVSDDLLFLVLIFLVLVAARIVIKDTEIKFTLFVFQDKRNLIFSVFIVLVNISLLVSSFYQKEYYQQIFNSALTYFFLFVTLMTTRMGKDFSERHKDLFFTLYIFLFALLHIIGVTSKEIRSVVNGKYYGTEIVTADTTYTSTAASYYIGQTDKFVFVYDSSRHCKVIPVSSIKQMDIHTNVAR